MRVKWSVVASSVDVILTIVVCVILGNDMLLVQVADYQLAIIRDGKQTTTPLRICHGSHIVLMVINCVERTDSARILPSFSRLDLGKRADVLLWDLPKFDGCIIGARQ